MLENVFVTLTNIKSEIKTLLSQTHIFAQIQLLSPPLIPFASCNTVNQQKTSTQSSQADQGCVCECVRALLFIKNLKSPLRHLYTNVL